MDVDLDRPRVAGDHDRVAHRLEPIAEDIDVERSAGRRLEQEHRLVAEALVRVRDERRGPGGRSSTPCRRDDPAAAGDVEERPLQEAIQALTARVDHARLAQDREQAGRLRDGPVGRLDRRREDRLDVVVVLSRQLGGRRGLADHGQDRALDRLLHGCIRGLRRQSEGMGQIEPVDPLLARDRPRHPVEDLRRDHPGIAAGAHERPEADRRGDPIGRPAGRSFGLVERDADGGGHVRTGVAVGHWEDVEVVDLVDVGLEVGDRGAECRQETVAVAASAGHARTSAAGGFGSTVAGTGRGVEAGS